MKKIYLLGNCITCQDIMKKTGIEKKGFFVGSEKKTVEALNAALKK